MPDEKFRVSWDEVRSARVDAKLKQQEALAHAQQHLQQQSPPVSVPTPAPGGRSEFLYNTLVYMALFGVAGGLVAWGLGEVAWGKMAAFERYAREESEIVARHARHEISDETANQSIKNLQERFRGNPYIAELLDTSRSEDERARRFKEKVDKVSLIWLTLSGVSLALFLSVAEPSVSRNVNGVVINGSVGAVLGLVGGLILSLFIDPLYRTLGGGSDASFGQQVFARAVGWGILGLFLALGPGIILKNARRMFIGLGGGLIGGLIGGALFDLMSKWADSSSASRLIGMTAIGCFAGLGTGILENVAKTGWLRVAVGLIAGKQFVLYRNPTVIGSSPQAQIYLFKDPNIRPVHALIHLVPGGFELEDQQSSTGTFVNGHPIGRVRLRSGDQIQIGGTGFVFYERAQPSA